MLPGHHWNVTPTEAITLQKQLKNLVQIAPLSKKVQVIAGADVSMNRFESVGYAGIVLLLYPELHLLGHAVAKGELTFPYIPGLLSFREIPLLLEAFKKLPLQPDVLMVDGQGIAHPRRLGIATPWIGNKYSNGWMCKIYSLRYL